MRRENLSQCSQHSVKCAGEGRGNRGEEDGGGLVGSKKARKSSREDAGIQQPRDRSSNMHVGISEQDVALANSMLISNAAW